MESGNSALASGADRDRCGLLRQPQHSSAVGWSRWHFHSQSQLPALVNTQRIGSDLCNPTHDPNSTAVSDYLNTEVPNPFQCFFTTAAALTGSWCPASPIFNAADVADSRYVDDYDSATIAAGTLSAV